MKKIIFLLVLALGLVVGSSSSVTVKGHTVVPAALVAPAADAKAPPSVCGNCEGGGGWYDCDANHAGQPDANGNGYCHQEALPSWPYYRWTFY